MSGVSTDPTSDASNVASEQTWTAALDAVRRTSRAAREAVHRAAGRPGCPGRRSDGPAGQAGHPPHDECVAVGCADLLQDVTLRVVERMGEGHAIPAPAVLDQVARSQLAEQRRADRVRRGHPARPVRDDGPAGAVVAAIGELAPGPVEREWLVALFRMVRSYPYKPGRTLVGWPLESWAAERSAHLGGVAVTPGQVAADLRWLLDVAAEVAGAAWVHTQILVPLAAVESGEEDLPGASAGVSVEDRALLLIFASVYAAGRRAGRSEASAWAEARRTVGGGGSRGSRARPPGWAVELLTEYGAPPPGGQVARSRVGAAA